MIKVIFDSSFLMAVAENPTTWFEDISERVGAFEAVALDCVAEELTRLAFRGGSKGRLASVALQLASGFSREECGEGDTDGEIISAALSSGAAVATADRHMISTLGARRVKVIELRSGRVQVL